MPAVALTDSSNLYGAFHFVDAIHKHSINKEAKQHNDKVYQGELETKLKAISFEGYRRMRIIHLQRSSRPFC